MALKLATLVLLRHMCWIPGLAALMQEPRHQQQQLHASDHEGAQQQPMVREPQEHQEIIVCNAFADSGLLEATIMPAAEPLKSLGYKECSRTTLMLREGDKLDFRCRGFDVGTFGISGLPRAAQTLLLIVQRRSGPRLSMSAAFTSHAFAAEATGAAQVAVVDASQGAPCGERSHGQVSVLDFSEDPANLTRQRKVEPLPMNAVVALSPGLYHVAMSSEAGRRSEDTNQALDVRPKGSYVVLRVGGVVPESKAPGFPEEIVVFPQVGGARRVVAPVVSLLLAALLVPLLLL